MKKPFIILCAAALMLAGCADKEKDAELSLSSVPKLEEILPEPSEPEPPVTTTTTTTTAEPEPEPESSEEEPPPDLPEGNTEYDLKDFTIEFPTAWALTEENGTEYYDDKYGHAGYMINSYGSDNGLSVRDILNRYRKAVSEYPPLYAPGITKEIEDKNGNKLLTAQIGYTEKNGPAVLQFIFCRDRSYFITIKATSWEESRRQELMDNLEMIAGTVTFEKLDDVISGRTFVIEEDDGCEMHLYADGKLHITYDRDDGAEVYGEYKVYRGSAALDKVEAEGNFDPEQKIDYMTENKIPLTDYYAVVFTYQRVYRWGGLIKAVAYDVVCDGFPTEDKVEMYNYSTNATFVWDDKNS